MQASRENGPNGEGEKSVLGDADTVERIRSEVVAMLERGELAPGERLREARLARRLNIGRNATREALRSLEQAGLVRIVPNRGAEVRKLSLEEALELYDIRAGLARTAGRLAAKRLGRVQLEELKDLQRQLQVAISQDDARLYNTVNSRFHAVVFDGARNKRLSAFNDMVDEELNLFLSRSYYSADAFATSWAEHQRLLDALLVGDEASASAAFEDHIIGGKSRLVNGEVTVRL